MSCMQITKHKSIHFELKRLICLIMRLIHFSHISRNALKRIGLLTSCCTKKQVRITPVLFVFLTILIHVTENSLFFNTLFFSFSFAIEEPNSEEPNNCTKDINTDPWPGYRYTGKLHPHYPLVRSLHFFFLRFKN